MRHLACASTLLLACHQAPMLIARPTIVTRPIHVLVDPALPTCEVMAVLFAVDFWRQHGVTADVDYYVIGTPGKRGDVVVLDGDIATEGLVGLTMTLEAQVVPGHPEVWAAAITLDSCLNQVAAHEIGHALGLPHRDVKGALMNATIANGGWDVSREEQEWVRD